MDVYTPALKFSSNRKWKNLYINVNE
jgi:hypothetical protein